MKKNEEQCEIFKKCWKLSMYYITIRIEGWYLLEVVYLRFFFIKINELRKNKHGPNSNNYFIKKITHGNLKYFGYHLSLKIG